MSVCNFDSRSQYSMLDESIQIYSTCSKNRNSKYFTRRPLDATARINEVTKRKNRDAHEFAAFYSPTSKHDALMKKNYIQKAFMRGPSTKIDQGQTPGVRSLDHQVTSRNNATIRESINNPQQFFKKPKTHTQNDNGQNPAVPDTRQSSEAAPCELEVLRQQNCRLRQEVSELRKTYNVHQAQVKEICNLKDLNAKVQEALRESVQTNTKLQEQIQRVKQCEAESSQTLDGIYNESIGSLTQINSMLKQKVVSLQHDLKYAGLEITILRAKLPSDLKQNINKIIDERNKLKKLNRDLRVQLIQERQKHHQDIFQISPASTDRAG